MLATKLTGKEIKRAYITIKTGEKKDKSGSYAVATVYDPNAEGGTQQSNTYAKSQGVPSTSQSNKTDDLPF
jgi:hypothetical protein